MDCLFSRCMQLAFLVSNCCADILLARTGFQLFGYHTERCMAPEFLNRFLLILRRVQSNLAAALRQGIEGGIVQFTL